MQGFYLKLWQIAMMDISPFVPFFVRKDIIFTPCCNAFFICDGANYRTIFFTILVLDSYYSKSFTPVRCTIFVCITLAACPSQSPKNWGSSWQCNQPMYSCLLPIRCVSLTEFILYLWVTDLDCRNLCSSGVQLTKESPASQLLESESHSS